MNRRKREQNNDLSDATLRVLWRTVMMAAVRIGSRRREESLDSPLLQPWFRRR